MFGRILIVSLAVVSLARAECTSPGKERWAIKSSVPAGSDFNHAQALKLVDVVKLENPPGAKNKDARFESSRIPAFSNPLKVREGDFVTLSGYLYLVATEDNDCEYHIQISDQPRTTTNKPAAGDQCVIVEIGRPDAIPDADLSKRADTVRSYIRTKLLQNKEPSSTTHGSVMQHPVYVKVSGQLFFDDAHLKSDGTSQPRGKGGMSTATLWELHPIYDLQIVKAPAQ